VAGGIEEIVAQSSELDVTEWAEKPLPDAEEYSGGHSRISTGDPVASMS